jgi:hypothetical protein
MVMSVPRRAVTVPMIVAVTVPMIVAMTVAVIVPVFVLCVFGHDVLVSLQVGVNHIDEVLRAFGTLSIPLVCGIGDVHADVIFEQLGHEAAGSTAHGHRQLHDLGTIAIRLQRALDGIDLATQPPDAL